MRLPAKLITEVEKKYSIEKNAKGQFNVQYILHKIVDSLCLNSNTSAPLPIEYFSDFFTGESIRVRSGEIPPFVIEILQNKFGSLPLTQLIKQAMLYVMSLDVHVCLGKETLMSPISSIGGKNFAYQILSDYIVHKDVNLIVEPFARTAAVMMNYGKDIKRIYNDFDITYAIFYRCLRNDVGRLIAELEPYYELLNKTAKLSEKSEQSEIVNNLYKELRVHIIRYYNEYCEKKSEKKRRYRDSKLSKSDYDIAAKLFLLTKMAMRGDITQGVCTRFFNVKTYDIDKAHLRACSYRIRNMAITCKDFASVIREYRKDPNALIFADPPYLTLGNSHMDEDYLPPFALADIRRLLKALKLSECRVVMTHYLDWRVDDLARQAGLTPTFAYISQLTQQSPTVVYLKNIELNTATEYGCERKLLYLDKCLSFGDMQTRISEYFQSLKMRGDV